MKKNFLILFWGIALLFVGCSDEPPQGEAYYYGTYESSIGTVTIEKSGDKQFPSRFIVKTKEKRNDGSTWRCSFEGVGKIPAPAQLGYGVEMIIVPLDLKSPGQIFNEALVFHTLNGGRDISVEGGDSCTKMGGTMEDIYAKKTKPVPQDMKNGIACKRYDYYSIGSIIKYEKNQDGYGFEFRGYEGGEPVKGAFGIPSDSKLYELIDYFIANKGFIGESNYLSLFFSGNQICGIIPVQRKKFVRINNVQPGKDSLFLDLCERNYQGKEEKCFQTRLLPSHVGYEKLKNNASSLIGREGGVILRENGDIQELKSIGY